MATPILPAPFTTEVDICNKKCSYQNKITGTANFNGVIYIAEATDNFSVWATAVTTDGVWEAFKDSFTEDVNYVAFGVPFDGTLEPVVAIDAEQSCEKQCILSGTFKGVSEGLGNGILMVFVAPYTEGDLPIATTPIVGGLFNLKSEVLEPKEKYVLRAINTEGID